MELCGYTPPPWDTWTARAHRDRHRHLKEIRNGKAFGNFDTYVRAIGDLERVLSRHRSSKAGWRLGLADIACEHRRPTHSGELVQAAEDPLSDPFVAALRPRLEALVEAGGFTHAGISVNYLTQAPSAFALIGLLRRLLPGIPIILGGGLVTSWLSRPDWKNPFGGLVDCLATGPGVEPLLRFLGIANSLRTGEKDDSPTEKPTDMITEPMRALLPRFTRIPSLEHCGNTYPPGDYLGNYFGDYFSPGLILPFSTANGCWWRKCAFCPERAEGGTYQPFGTPAETVDGIHRLVQLYQPRLIHLLDDAVSPAILRELAQRPAGVSWYGFVRFGPPLDEPEACRALARSGCVMLQLGLESGDARVLDAMGKGIDPAIASKILNNLHEAGIANYVYLLFGTPAESENEARTTLSFVARHASAIDFLNLAIFNLPAFGPETAALSTAPVDDGDLGFYRRFKHPLGWDRHHVRRFINGEFKRHPAIAPILRRDPPIFTSSHAPFFTRGMGTQRT